MTEASVVKHLTADQLAERWGRSRYQVYEMAKRGVLPVLRIGRSVRFRLTDIEAWEERQVRHGEE